MSILIIKSLHIIFMVTWFAALFYMFRLFIYHVEASEKQEPDRSILLKQFKLMEHRLWYYISWPSAILTVTFGLWLLFDNLNFLKQPWMLMKLFLVVLLILYHLYGQSIYKSGKLDNHSYTSFFLRLMNEVATIFLFGIVFLVELQSMVSWTWGIIGLLGLSFLIYLAVRKYRDKRAKNEQKTAI
jgi:putative membrane protein